MTGPPRSALAALEAGIAHVGRHHRALPVAGPVTLERRLALHVALNVVRELDTLLSHAVAETAALAGVVLSTPDGKPARTALAELRRVLDPNGDDDAGLAEADRMRDGVTQAVASRRAMARYRLEASYPVGIGDTYRRAAAVLARMIAPMPLRLGAPVRGVVVGDDGAAAHR